MRALYFYKIVSSVLGVCTTLILAMILGAANRGEYALIVTICTTLSTFLHLSYGQLFLSTYKNAKDKDIELNIFKMEIMSYLVSIFMISCFALLIFSFLSLRYIDIGIIVVLSTLSLIFNVYCQNICIAKDTIPISVKIELASRVSVLICIVILNIFVKLNAFQGLSIYLLGNMLVSILYMYHVPIKFVYLDPRPHLRAVYIRLKETLILHLNTVLTAFMISTDIFMIRYLLDSFAVGNYQLGVMLVNFLLLIPSLMAQMMYSSAIKVGLDINVKDNASTGLLVVIVLAIFTIIAYLMKGVIVSTLGTEYRIFSDLVPYFCVLAILMSIAQFTGHQWVLRQKYKELAVIGFSMFVLNAVLNYYFIISLGVYGAIYATIISYTFVLLVNFYAGFKVYGKTI